MSTPAGPLVKKQLPHVVNIDKAPIGSFYLYDVKCACGWEARVNSEQEAKNVRDNHIANHPNVFVNR